MESEFLLALGSGEWSAVAGLALLMLAPAILYVLDGKVSETAAKWLSLVRGVAVGLGSGLVATAASGGAWWLGIVTGGVGLVASQGFLDLVRALLPDRRV